MAIEQELTVAVMGATGTGKSTFVNLASGSSFPVGQGLKSCTPAVQVTQIFNLGGRKIRLIDTPGFDDTTRTDTEILKMIVDFLADQYRQSKTLSGIIYMHRISDIRMTGVSKRNFGMFRSLCGEQTLRNVVVVTNMWGEVSEAVGVAREKELATDGILFKPVLDKGATMYRHYNTAESVQAILRKFVDNHPTALQVQTEVVNQGKSAENTTAGLELQREVNEAIAEAKRRQDEELRRAREAMEAAAREQERKRAQEVERARREMEERLARERAAHERELARQAEERRQEEARRAELQRAHEAEQAANRAREAEARRVQEEMARQAREAAEAQARMMAEMQRLQRRRRGGGDCIIC